MNSIISDYDFKGIRCVKMQHGKYSCVVAPSLGASVLRLRDEENKIDVFRYDENASAQQLETERTQLMLQQCELKIDQAKLQGQYDSVNSDVERLEPMVSSLEKSGRAKKRN